MSHILTDSFNLFLFSKLCDANDELCFDYKCKAVVSFGGVKSEQKEEAEKLGLVIHAWDEFLKLVGDFHLRYSEFFFTYLLIL